MEAYHQKVLIAVNVPKKYLNLFSTKAKYRGG